MGGIDSDGERSCPELGLVTLDLIFTLPLTEETNPNPIHNAILPLYSTKHLTLILGLSAGPDTSLSASMSPTHHI